MHISKLKQSADNSTSKIKHNYYIIKLVFKIVNLLYIFFFIIELAIQQGICIYQKKKKGICNFVFSFGMLILCKNETFVFVLIRFSNC